ncbi:unnamed protein product [Toxocara canis]|uniref:Uncharacterized protein n=1 Tax=Toxocara canis TaxID=6265 RepID=A0A3P7F4D8_TOXCA|nr:unnamed protein product [Toxocara canis]
MRAFRSVDSTKSAGGVSAIFVEKLRRLSQRLRLRVVTRTPKRTTPLLKRSDSLAGV